MRALRVFSLLVPVITVCWAADGRAARPRVFVKGAAVVGGGGELEYEKSCTGSPCANYPELELFSRSEAEDESGLGIGVEFLFGDRIRFGPGALYTTDVTLEPSDDPDFEFGTNLQTYAFIEVPVSQFDNGEIYLKGLGGLLLLLPGDDLEVRLDEESKACDRAPAEVTCKVNEGPFVGFAFGGGGGVSFDLEREQVSLRVELLLQLLHMPFREESASGRPPGRGMMSTETIGTYSGSRWLLAAGLVF